MNARQPRQLLGFGLVAVGVLAAAVWLGFVTSGTVGGPVPSTVVELQSVAEPPSDTVPELQRVAVQPDAASGARPWLPVVAAMFMLAGAAVLFLPRPQPGMESAAAAVRDIASALERQHDQLEPAAALPELVRSSLKSLGQDLQDIGRKLDRHSDRLEQLAIELAEVRRADDEVRTADGSGDEEPEAADTASPEDDGAPSPDLGQELRAAWMRYRDEGDGHFNAQGLGAELAARSIVADVRQLGDDAGEAVLAIDNPQSSDRSFLVVPDFTRSPKSAERWFEDESGGRLGSRTNEIKKLARGRWTESGPKVVTKGSVA